MLAVPSKSSCFLSKACFSAPSPDDMLSACDAPSPCDALPSCDALPPAETSSSACERLFLIFSFISAAAALVKVTINILSTGHFSSMIKRFMRSTRTAVLPEPAAAATRIFLFHSPKASCCSLVHFIRTRLLIHVYY